MSGGSNGLTRLTPDQAQERLQAWATPVATVVDVDGRPLDEPVQLPVSERKPITPAPVKTPVTSSARVGEIRSDGAATAAAISSGYVEERARVQGERGKSQARLAWLRRRRGALAERIEAMRSERDRLVAGLPGRLRRRVGQRFSRVARWTPWAMFGADVSLMANPYGIFGGIALPFPSSSYIANATQLLRAGFVAFGLTFGLKLVGSRFRDLAEELRGRSTAAGMGADAFVITVVVVAAVLLASAAARLQAVFLAVATGGSTVSVPTSVLFSIVAFLGAVSFASGFFGNEPELEQVASLDALLTALVAEQGEVEELIASALGELRALRARARAVDEAERLDLEEHARHTDRTVYAHLASDTPLYGVEFAAAEARVPGAPA